MSSATPGSRNLRKALLGFVTSRSGDKSVKVTIPYKTPHPLFHKVINRKTVVHVHDEKNETKVGDKVKIMETRPISRLKRWRVVNIVTVEGRRRPPGHLRDRRRRPGPDEDDEVGFVARRSLGEGGPFRRPILSPPAP